MMTAAATFADKALPLAAQGTPCFPCGQDKRPLCRNGFHAAATDAATLSAWSRKHPAALVGVPTGGDSFVLDIDVASSSHSADGLLTLKQHGWSLPATMGYRTRSGGQHRWLRAPPGQTVKSSAGKLGPGLDIRGEGGYVIYWPAEGLPIESEGILANAPDWLLTALIDGGSRRQLTTPASGTIDNSDLWAGYYPALTPARVISLLAAIDPDSPYDDWLRVGLALHHELGDEGLKYWCAWSSRGDKYPGPRVLLRHWNSFACARPGAVVTTGTLVALANANKKETAHVG